MRAVITNAFQTDPGSLLETDRHLLLHRTLEEVLSQSLDEQEHWLHAFHLATALSMGTTAEDIPMDPG